MAKHTRGRKRRSRFQAVRFNAQTALGTLADATVLNTAITTLTQDAYLISADVSVSFRGATALDGPIQFGFAHSDLSVTEIAECLDASIPNDSAIIEKERARRPVRRIGRVMEMIATGGSGMWNGGNEKRVKLGFFVSGDQELVGWVRNQFGAPLTTGAIVEWQGTLYLSWK